MGLNSYLPSYIQSLDCSDIKSEVIALNCAVASGIIAHFTEDEELIPTVSGRMGSGKFSFDIQDIVAASNRQVSVENSQIEIDAAYEGIRYLTLFEAKRDLSKDFLVRQLYYPYRVWKDKVTKEVKPVFVIYSNGIYRMYEYAFQNPNEYSSIVLVKQQNYAIEDAEISINDIMSILKNIRIVEEPSKIPFPQADMIERVINLCELLSDGSMDRNNITETYDFASRQTDYYTDAARYLGLIVKDDSNQIPIYSLSDLGKKILKMGYKNRQLAFCQCILSHKIFHIVLDDYLSKGIMLKKIEIIKLMKNNNLCSMQSDKTFNRRASTIIHWINWIVSLINE